MTFDYHTRPRDGIRILVTDMETRSATRDPGTAGSNLYHEDSDIMHIAYGFVGEDEIGIIDLMHPGYEAELAQYLEWIRNPEILKIAHNASFERAALRHHFDADTDPAQWDDTMAMARRLGLPSGLGNLCKALKLDADSAKDSIGKKLISTFSKPHETKRGSGEYVMTGPDEAPEEYAQMMEYCRQDVKATIAAYQAMLEMMPDESEAGLMEKRVWNLDMAINERGVLVDRQLVETIAAQVEIDKTERAEQICRMTGVAKAGSRDQIINWIKDQTGETIESLDKNARPALLAREDFPAIVHKVLELYDANQKTSLQKFKAIEARIGSDGRVRDQFQYAKCITWRWSSTGAQLHNLSHDTPWYQDDARELAKDGHFGDMETLFGPRHNTLATLIRTCFIPREGYEFVIYDFSAIEARVIAYIASQEWVLEAFKAGRDIYCETAKQAYGLSECVKGGINGEYRAKGKILTLACGYQGNVNAIDAFDRKGEIPLEDRQDAIRRWRKANPRIVQMWYDLQDTARQVITTHDPVITKYRGIRIFWRGTALFIGLPSGRYIAYQNARIRKDPYTNREEIVYADPEKGTVLEKKLYGGLITENIVQAFARDCLAEAMLKVSDAGYDIVMHVHDEMIIECPIERVEQCKKDVARIMATPPDWAPDLPIKGDGYSAPYYRKE